MPPASAGSLWLWLPWHPAFFGCVVLVTVVVALFAVMVVRVWSLFPLSSSPRPCSPGLVLHQQVDFGHLSYYFARPPYSSIPIGKGIVTKPKPRGLHLYLLITQGQIRGRTAVCRLVSRNHSLAGVAAPALLTFVFLTTTVSCWRCRFCLCRASSFV